MRVAIATGHDKLNYGSMLQAYATQSAISSLGCEAVTLNRKGLGLPISKGRFKYYMLNAVKPSFYKAKGGLILHRIRRATNSDFKAKMAKRYERFLDFENTHFNLSPEICSFEKLTDYCRSFDAVVVGSDQLWTEANIAGNYYTLSFVPEGVARLSYATSFGVSALSPSYMRRATEFLSSYDHISVREESGAAIVSHACNRNAAVVCDPTMLLTANEWEGQANNLYEIGQEPYVFCYFLGKNLWNRECARWLADSSECKVLAISHCDEYIQHDDAGYADYQPYDVGPAEWLSLIKNARFVCTDSFHGTVFSILFGKEFFAFRRHENLGLQSTNSRLDSLLNRLDLVSRLCDTKEAFYEVAGNPINWRATNESLVAFRAESNDWLTAALGLCDNQ